MIARWALMRMISAQFWVNRSKNIEGLDQRATDA